MKHTDFAPTPPMGWNSWDCYGAAVNEEQLLGNARYMADNLLKHGWDIVTCDIQWSEPNARDTFYAPNAPLCMDEFSRLIPAENRFPSSAGGRGFLPISREIHKMGLRFGIHIMRGIPRQAVYLKTKIKGTDLTADAVANPFSTCPWNSDMYGVNLNSPGAQAYYDSLFELYAEWEIDFVKVDDIASTSGHHTDRGRVGSVPAVAEIEMIRRAIDKCGRPIILSLSPGPAAVEYSWMFRKNANMWRMTNDVWDNRGDILHMFARCESWQGHGGNGCWPDCDMLPFGHINCNSRFGDNYCRLTQDEQITMMNLWSIFRSPLIVGAELRDNDEFTLSLLTNDEVLRLNKHSFSPNQIYRNRDSVAWYSFDDGTDGGGLYYVALFNLKDEPATVTVRADQVDAFELRGRRVRDLWRHKDIGITGDFLSANLPPHGSVIYRLT